MCNSDLPGKLKKTTTFKCPNCHKAYLQIRVMQKMALEEGEDIIIGTDIVVCPCCHEEYDDEVIRIKTRRKHSEQYGYGYL